MLQKSIFFLDPPEIKIFLDMNVLGFSRPQNIFEPHRIENIAGHLWTFQDLTYLQAVV